MGKLIKYEIKGSYKLVLYISLIMLILMGFLFSDISKLIVGEKVEFTGLMAFLSFALPLIFIAGSVGLFFYIVNLFKKDLYEDRGYLTFTLPLSGESIVGAKLITALLWFFVVSIPLMVFLLALSFKGLNTELGISSGLRELVFENKLEILSVGLKLFLVVLTTNISLLLTIYFSMSLSRVAIRNKKHEGIWIWIFLGLTSLIGFLEKFLMRKLPYYFSFGNYTVSDFDNIDKSLSIGGQSIVSLVDQTSIFFKDNLGNTQFNIVGCLFVIFMNIALFKLTAYLIEKKIDL